MAAQKISSTLPNGQVSTSYQVVDSLPNGGSVTYAGNAASTVGSGSIATTVVSSTGETLASQGQTKIQVLNELADNKADNARQLAQTNANISALQQKADAATTPEEKASLDRRIRLQQNNADRLQQNIDSADAAAKDVDANYDSNKQSIQDSANADASKAEAQTTKSTTTAEAQAASQQTSATANTNTQNDTSGATQVTETAGTGAPPPAPPPIEQVSPAQANVESSTPTVQQGPPDPYAGLTDAQKESLGNADATDPYIRARLGLPPYNPDTPVTTQETKNIDGKNSLGFAAGASKISVTEQASDVSVKKNVTAVGGNQVKTADPTPNPLDAYSSYTYNITLHVLTREDYNKMVQTPKSFKPTKTLISTAGRYRNTYTAKSKDGTVITTGRDPAFGDDFYFDNLKFETVVGLNAKSRGGNMINLEFTIIEPYGMTLLDRLMDVNNKGLNGKNYLDMPYLLEISFFGATDSGEMKKIEDQTKWFPIKIIGFKIKAGVKGAEYQVSAVPFNHSANFETVQSLKTRMSVSAQTVGEYFSSDITEAISQTVTQAIAEDETRKTKKAAAPKPAEKTETRIEYDAQGNVIGEYSAPTSVRTTTPAKDAVAQTPIIINTKSFPAAYNAWFEAQKKKGTIGATDMITFHFPDEELKNSKIVDAKKNSSRKIDDVEAADAARANEGQDTALAKFDSVVHDLEAGTSVNEIINLVLPQSEYFLKQVIDGSTETKQKENGNDDATSQKKAEPVKLWKIIPTVELLDYDNERNTWSKKMTFTVKTFNAFQKRDDRLPQSTPPKPVKKYDYMYTGHNSAVINFDIDFNALYFTAKNADRGAKTAGTGPAQTSEENKNNEKPDSVTDNRQIGPEMTQPIADDYETSAGGSQSRGETIQTKSALKSVYTSAGGDMISLKLQIIGDPEFIKQDDLFISPLSDIGAVAQDPASPYVPGTKSIDMDNSEIFCYVTFKTPSDFNDETGMYDLDSTNKYKVSEFSGYYKVITVTNEFRNGKFTQTLDTVRQPKQDPINQSVASSTAVTTTGQSERTDKNTSKSIQTGNPAVSSQNLDTGSSTPITPTQASQSERVEKGPDKDATTTTTRVITTTEVTDTGAQVATATTEFGDRSMSAVSAFGDKQMASVAKFGKTTTIGETAPSDNTSGVTSTGSSETGGDDSTGAANSGASVSGAGGAAASITSQGGSAKSGTVNTGESVVGASTGVNKDEAASKVQESRSVINNLKATNKSLAAQIDQLGTQQESLFAEYEQLKQQFGSDPTKEQIAQLRQKTQEISRLRSQRSELRQQIDANAQAAAAEADKANQIASSAGIQGIDLAAEYQ